MRENCTSGSAGDSSSRGPQTIPAGEGFSSCVVWRLLLLCTSSGLRRSAQRGLVGVLAAHRTTPLKAVFNNARIARGFNLVGQGSLHATSATPPI